jgi:hypothetical protein|tara:strand:- start:1895 stop:2161 length:267 start_codon:yes stop_codon:yes gene_type:complete
MISKDREMDWIDEILEDTPINLWQIGKIEGLLITSAANYIYNNINLNDLTEDEADKIIRELLWNDRPKDPKHQYEQMRRGGMFNERFE